MKVAYFIHTLTVGGAESIVVNYLVELKKQQQEVCLIEYYKTGSFLTRRLEKENIPIYNILPFKGNNICERLINKVYLWLFAEWKIKRIIKNNNIEIFHNHSSWNHFKDIGLNYNNIYYTFHTSIERSMRLLGSKNNNNLIALVEKGINLVVLTEDMKKEVLNYFDTKRIFVSYNGIDLEQITAERYDKSFLETLGINKDNFIVGHVGRFHPVKNHEKLIEVFYEINKEIKDSYLLLVGTGEDTDILRIKKLIDYYNLKDRVVMLGSREDATKIMGVFDLLVFPSIIEGFSLVTIEAEALNINSVISDSIPKEVVVRNNCVQLPICLDSKEWAKIALNNIKKEESINDLEKFYIKNIVKKLIKLYEENMGHE